MESAPRLHQASEINAVARFRNGKPRNQLVLLFRSQKSIKSLSLRQCSSSKVASSQATRFSVDAQVHPISFSLLLCFIATTTFLACSAAGTSERPTARTTSEHGLLGGTERARACVFFTACKRARLGGGDVLAGI